LYRIAALRLSRSWRSRSGVIRVDIHLFYGCPGHAASHDDAVPALDGTTLVVVLTLVCPTSTNGQRRVNSHQATGVASSQELREPGVRNQVPKWQLAHLSNLATAGTCQT